MNFARATPSPESSDSLAAFIEIAKNPALFEAKLQELRSAEAAAKAAIDEMAEKSKAFIARSAELNDRDAALARSAAALEAKASALANGTIAFESASIRRTTEMDKRNTALNEREASIKDSEEASAKLAADTEDAWRRAQGAQAQAEKLRAKLADIASHLDGLKGALAGI